MKYLNNLHRQNKIEETYTHVDLVDQKDLVQFITMFGKSWTQSQVRVKLSSNNHNLVKEITDASLKLTCLGRIITGDALSECPSIWDFRTEQWCWCWWYKMCWRKGKLKIFQFRIVQIKLTKSRAKIKKYPIPVWISKLTASIGCLLAIVATEPLRNVKSTVDIKIVSSCAVVYDPVAI